MYLRISVVMGRQLVWVGAVARVLQVSDGGVLSSLLLDQVWLAEGANGDEG